MTFGNNCKIIESGIHIRNGIFANPDLLVFNKSELLEYTVRVNECNSNVFKLNSEVCLPVSLTHTFVALPRVQYSYLVLLPSVLHLLCHQIDNLLKTCLLLVMILGGEESTLCATTHHGRSDAACVQRRRGWQISTKEWTNQSGEIRRK